MAREPIAACVSAEAMFESYEDRRPGKDGIILVMRPHGVAPLAGDDRESGWVLTWEEVHALRTLLSETLDYYEIVRR